MERRFCLLRRGHRSLVRHWTPFFVSAISCFQVVLFFLHLKGIVWLEKMTPRTTAYDWPPLLLLLLLLLLQVQRGAGQDAATPTPGSETDYFSRLVIDKVGGRDFYLFLRRPSKSPAISLLILFGFLSASVIGRSDDDDDAIWLVPWPRRPPVQERRRGALERRRLRPLPGDAVGGVAQPVDAVAEAAAAVHQSARRRRFTAVPSRHRGASFFFFVALLETENKPEKKRNSEKPGITRYNISHLRICRM